MLGIGLLLCASAQAETYRVNPSKTRQLSSLLANLHDGDTVIFERGVYDIAKGLEVTGLNNVTLAGEGKVEIVLGNLDEPVLSISACTRVRIRGLRARHQKPNREYACEGAVIEVRNAEHVAITECRLNGCGAAGVYATDSQDVVVANNTIFNNTFSAVWLYNSSALVRGNHIYDNATEVVTGGNCDLTMIANKTENNHGNDDSMTDWARESLGER